VAAGPLPEVLAEANVIRAFRSDRMHPRLAADFHR